MAPDQQCSNIAGVHRLYTRIEVNILFSPLLTRHDARRKLGRVRIFADAQAAITRMTHDEPGPGQTYALQVRMAIATLREREPSVEIKIRWCPAHNGIPGNEVADGWAKQAASEPDDNGVEWLAYVNGVRRPLPPTSLAHLKRRPRRRSGRKPGRGASGDSSTGATFSEKKAIPIRPHPGRRRGRPRGSTSSSPGVYLKSTENRPDETTAGGASRKTIVVLARRETTCSSTATSGRTSRP